MPADDDAQAEEDVESDDEELEDGLDGMEMDDDARARRPKAKYMKMFVSCGRCGLGKELMGV